MHLKWFNLYVKEPQQAKPNTLLLCNKDTSDPLITLSHLDRVLVVMLLQSNNVSVYFGPQQPAEVTNEL